MVSLCMMNPWLERPSLTDIGSAIPWCNRTDIRQGQFGGILSAYPPVCGLRHRGSETEGVRLKNNLSSDRRIHSQSKSDTSMGSSGYPKGRSNKAITFILASLGDLFHHSQPYGRPASGEQAAQHTEDVQHGEGHCKFSKSRTDMAAPTAEMMMHAVTCVLSVMMPMMIQPVAEAILSSITVNIGMILEVPKFSHAEVGRYMPGRK